MSIVKKLTLEDLTKYQNMLEDLRIYCEKFSESCISLEHSGCLAVDCVMNKNFKEFAMDLLMAQKINEVNIENWEKMKDMTKKEAQSYMDRYSKAFILAETMTHSSNSNMNT